MNKQYEHVSPDCGHEYTTPCELLMETELSWFTRADDGQEQQVRKDRGSDFVREVKDKVDIYTLVAHFANMTDAELCEGEQIAIGSDWVKSFANKLIKTGALKEGSYER